MPVNKYFNNFTYGREQDLLEDLIIESIKVYGHEMKYLPRTLVEEDHLFGEAKLSKFDDSVPVEMYIKNVEGFEGEGDLLSKFGVEIRDQMTFTIARKRFDQIRGGESLQTEVGYQLQSETANTDSPSRQFLTDNADVHGIIIESGTEGANNYTITSNRPNEGDLIYFPLTDKLFEIKFVEHEEVFYQMGRLQTYDLRCELFQYSSERIDTGDSDVDTIEDELSTDILFNQLTLEEALARAVATVSISSNSISSSNSVSNVTISDGGEYTTAPTVTFSAPTGGGNANTIVQFGSRSYKSTGSSVTISTSGVSDLQFGSVGFWFYVSSDYSGINTIVEFGANDNDTEKYSVSLQESGGTVQAFLKFPLNASSSGTGSSVMSNDLETNAWHFLQLAQIDQAFNSRQIHLDNESSFATPSYLGNIIDNNGFIIDPDENLSDGDVFFDEFYATTVNSEITLPTATLSGQTGEVFFQDGERISATGTAVLTGTSVTSVTITNGGRNYESAPTITFSQETNDGVMQSEDGDTVMQEFRLESVDDQANNEFFTTQALSGIIDFSESNPFSEVDRW